jgi:hypothetical protein
MEVAKTIVYYDKTTITVAKRFTVQAGNTKRGSITVQLSSCLTGLESAA